MTGLSISGLALFAAALAVAAFSPGPGIAAIVARVLGRGRSGAFAFTAGMAIGDIVWLTLAVLGLAVVAQTFHEVFAVIKYAGAAYLLFIAWKMWTAPGAAPELAPITAPESQLKLFFGGLAVCMGNPKTMVFYLALLPSILDITKIDGLAFLELSAVTLTVVGGIFAFYVVVALRARRLITSSKAVRIVNRSSSVVMAGAAVAIATR